MARSACSSAAADDDGGDDGDDDNENVILMLRSLSLSAVATPGLMWWAYQVRLAHLQKIIVIVIISRRYVLFVQPCAFCLRDVRLQFCERIA